MTSTKLKNWMCEPCTFLQIRLHIILIITILFTQGMKTSKIIKTIETIMDEIATAIKLLHMRSPLSSAAGFLSQT